MTDFMRISGNCTLTPNTTAPPSRGTPWRLAGHWGINIVLALLWAKFALNAYTRWTHTGSLMLLGLVLYNTLLVAVTIARRPSVSTSTRIKDWVVALLTVMFSLLFRSEQWHQSLPQALGSILQGAGLLFMVVALATLGRSFGVVAANRGIRRSGIYDWVRHPLYASEVMFFIGFLLSNTSPYNLLLCVSVLCGLVIRSWVEEAHLSHDPEYRTYMQAVPYRFFPGLF